MKLQVGDTLLCIKDWQRSDLMRGRLYECTSVHYDGDGYPSVINNSFAHRFVAYDPIYAEALAEDRVWEQLKYAREHSVANNKAYVDYLQYGIKGTKTPARALTTNSEARKDVPMFTGLIAYFPDALAEIARLSKAGNDKHNPGQPLHWSRHLSNDHLDCLTRHLADCGVVDTDGFLHDVKVAWRALANLQVALENQGA